MPIYFIRHLGANFAIIEPVGAVDPGFGHPGGGVDPDYGVGVRPHPGHGLPGGGHIDNALPGAPGSPGNELPANPPPVVPPGTVLVLVRTADGKWHYASSAAPPTVLPEPPGVGIWPKPRPPGVDNTLPGGAPVYPSQGLPPTAAPKA